MARRSGLGRGLGALIPADAAPSGAPSALREIAIGSIVANPHQPRTQFDEETLNSLAASIGEVGVLQPILVREVSEDSYELIAGERRWRAAKRAGLHEISAVVRTADDRTSVEQALIENLHRQDLNPLEEAGAFQQLIEDFGLTHEQVAKRIGKSRAAVTNTLRLLQLPASIQRFMVDGQLAAGHAKALLGTPDRAFAESLARRAVSENLSVRQVEEAVRSRESLSAPAGVVTPTGPTSRLRPPGLMELEQLLADRLDTRVSIDMGTKKGRVVVEFANLEDLERIYRVMAQATQL